MTTEPTGSPTSNSPTSNSPTSNSPTSNPEKDPQEWVTGDEPMTGPQQSYLQTLAREASEELPDNLTKAQASVEIERQQDKTGRGKS